MNKIAKDFGEQAIRSFPVPGLRVGSARGAAALPSHTTHYDGDLYRVARTRNAIQAPRAFLSTRIGFQTVEKRPLLVHFYDR